MASTRSEDLRLDAQLLVVDPPHVACRLWSDCHPRGTSLGLPVDGRRVAFAEHAVYRFDADRRVQRVWSVVDRAALAAQPEGAGAAGGGGADAGTPR